MKQIINHVNTLLIQKAGEVIREEIDQFSLQLLIQLVLPLLGDPCGWLNPSTGGFSHQLTLQAAMGVD